MDIKEVTSLDNIPTLIDQPPAQTKVFFSAPTKRKAFSQTLSKLNPPPRSIQLKEPKDGHPGGKGKSFPKSQIDFSSMVGMIPIVITDQEYKKRKKTFDTFLKMKDIEMMFGIKDESGRAEMIDKHASLATVQVLHSKKQQEVKMNVKNKKGKMYTNELWSMDYYTSVIKSSNLRRKVDHVANLMLKSTEVKAQELEDICKKKLDMNLTEKDKSLISGRGLGTNLSYRDEIVISRPSPTQQILETLPSPGARGHTALRSILKNISPPTEGNLSPALSRLSPFQGENSYRNSLLSQSQTPELPALKTPSTSTRKFAFKYPAKLQMNLERETDEDYVMLETTVEPRTSGNTPLAKGQLSSSRIDTNSPNFMRKSDSEMLLKSARLDETKKSGRLFGGKSNGPFNPLSYRSNEARLSPFATKNPDTQQKMQDLISQCIDFNLENKSLEKHVESRRTSLSHDVFRKKEHEKLQAQKEKDLCEALKRKAKFLQQLHSQKQGPVAE